MNIRASRAGFVNFINRLTMGICAIAIAFALSGCIKYETGINFYSLNDGEIIERIQLGKQLNTFSQTAVSTWLASIEQRTKQAQGRLERISDRELTVTIPFHNTRELVTKIDRYFNPEPTADRPQSQLNSQLHIDQNNFLLVVRNHLKYDIDLRAIAVPASTDRTTNAVDLNFSLQSSWGVKSISPATEINSSDLTNLVSEVAVTPIFVQHQTDRRISWQLQPGKLNHIEAFFWLPNPLGIGTILIIIITIGGYYLKYRQLPLQPAAK